MNQVQEKVIEIFKEIMDYPEEKEISLDTTLKDLGIDSMDLVEVVFAIETEFDIEISDEKLAKCSTIGSAIEHIESLVE